MFAGGRGHIAEAFRLFISSGLIFREERPMSLLPSLMFVKAVDEPRENYASHKLFHFI